MPITRDLFFIESVVKGHLGAVLIIQKYLTLSLHEKVQNIEYFPVNKYSSKFTSLS